MIYTQTVPVYSNVKELINLYGIFTYGEVNKSTRLVHSIEYYRPG